MASGGEKPPPSAAEALARLIEGNARFARGDARPAAYVAAESRAELAGGQQPFATILGCSDSRVPPEIVFDTGLGELFVVRVAGNVFSPEVAGSLQYAGAHLQTPLFVVLGHEGCGAVEAALQTVLEGAQHRSRIQILVNSILPGLGPPDANPDPKLRLDRAVESNVRWTVRQIMATPEARVRLAEGQVKIVGAIYELRSGRVTFLSD
jgi:carbonic anhydrase